MSFSRVTAPLLRFTVSAGIGLLIKHTINTDHFSTRILPICFHIQPLDTNDFRPESCPLEQPPAVVYVDTGMIIALDGTPPKAALLPSSELQTVMGFPKSQCATRPSSDFVDVSDGANWRRVPRVADNIYIGEAHGWPTAVASQLANHSLFSKRL